MGQERIKSLAGWAHFSHVADIGIRGFGKTLEQAFAQTALALTAAVTDPEDVGAAERISEECTAPDRELLLAEWLNTLVYEMATRKMLFSRFDLSIRGGRLYAEIWGEVVERERHQPAVEVKGATYTELSVSQAEDGTWIAQCVIDV